MKDHEIRDFVNRLTSLGAMHGGKQCLRELISNEVKSTLGQSNNRVKQEEPIMQTIWKYPIVTTDFQEVEIPQGAKVLTVQMQEGNPCLWALVDPNAEKQKRVIAVHGTGHPVPDAVGEYLGTYRMANGALVFHVFIR